jgi:hypothetical protein
MVSVLVFNVVDCVFDPRSTTLKASTLTITPPMIEHTIYHIKGKHANHYTADDRTNDLPH